MNRLQEIRLKKFEAQAGRCFYCECQIWEDCPSPNHRMIGTYAKWFRCTAEHLKAKCDGGKDASENIVAACHRCNILRHRRPKALEPLAYKKLVLSRISAGRWHNISGHLRQLIM